METQKLRAWWFARQGLDGRCGESDSASILNETGWARSVGGSNPYITLFARGGIDRASAENAAEHNEISELPAVRGCTYMLPARDYALGLAAGESFRAAEMRVAKKLGVTEAEIETLCEAIVDALGSTSLSPDEIRIACGDASRSLGEEGKKKGITTTVPLALGKLQAMGAIKRAPIGGRLDQQRYKYKNWVPNPRSGFSLTTEEVSTEIARRFFRWAGPATLAEFQWFSGLGVGASKLAVAPLDLVAIPEDPNRLIHKDDLHAWEAFQAPSEPTYALVSSIDGISLLRRDLKSIIDPVDMERPMIASKGMSNLGGLADLPSNAILDRGRLVGLWEYDTTSESIVWNSFILRNAELVTAVSTMETFIKNELGDARSFSLDSPKSREPLVNFLREAALHE